MDFGAVSRLGPGIVNIKDFRALTNESLAAVGLIEYPLPHRPSRIKTWQLPASDVVRFFAPHVIRYPWGFVLTGYVGIEIPAFRQWLLANKTVEETGVFHTDFVGYHIANEDGLREFLVEHGKNVPADLWAELIRDRLERIPDTVEELIRVYRSNREALGWLAHPFEKPMWDFLQAWSKDPSPELYVPRRSPTGQII